MFSSLNRQAAALKAKSPTLGVDGLSQRALSFGKPKSGADEALVQNSTSTQNAIDAGSTATVLLEESMASVQISAEPEFVGNGAGASAESEVKFKKSIFQVEEFTRRILPIRSGTTNKAFVLEETEVETEEDTKKSFFGVSQLTQRVMPKRTSTSDNTSSTADPVPESPPEDVYIVLRPINFKLSSEEMLQRIGEATDMAELQNYLLLQHWGVKVGDKYYHLHIVEETKADGKVYKNLAVTLSEFEKITIKFPIWQTSKSHDERVKNAVDIIKGMGGFKTEDEVRIYEDRESQKEQLIPDLERKRYSSGSETKKSLLPMPTIFSGQYNALTNSCITFTARYLLAYIFDLNPFNLSANAKGFRQKAEWLAYKWVASGCKIKPGKLINMLTSPLGLLNPMRTLSKTQDGSIFLVRLLLVFMGKIEIKDSKEVASIPAAIGQAGEEAASPDAMPSEDSAVEGDDIKA